MRTRLTIAALILLTGATALLLGWFDPAGGRGDDRDSAASGGPDRGAAAFTGAAPQTEPGRTGLDLGTFVVRAALADGTPAAVADFLVQEAGESRLVAAADGRLVLPRKGGEIDVAARTADGWSDLESLEAAERAQATELLLRAIERSGSLKLRASLSDGRPAPVHWSLQSNERRPGAGESAALRNRLYARALAGADAPLGEFLLEGVPPGRFGLRLRSEVAAPMTRGVELRAGENTLVVLELPLGAWVEGLVLGADRAPLAGAAARLVPADLGLLQDLLLRAQKVNDLGLLSQVVPPGGDGVTGADGRYRLGPLAAGEYRLLAHAAGYLSALAPGAALVAEGTTVELADTQLGRGHTLIVEVVAAEDQAPLEAARVRYFPGSRGESLVSGLLEWHEPPQALTDANGKITLATLPPGEVSVRVEREGRAPAESRAILPLADGAPLRIPMLRAIGLRGRVLDRDTLAPVFGAKISARGAAAQSELFLGMLPGGPAGGGEVATNDGGRFVLDNLAAGQWQVRVRADDYADVVAGPFHVETGLDDEIEILLGPGATLEVLLLDSDGGPMPQELVTVFGFANRDQRGERTDADGLVRFEHLLADHYQVSHFGMDASEQLAAMFSSDLAGFQSDSKTVEVGDDETVEIVLGGPVPRADLQGFVTRGGEPVAGVTVMVTSGMNFRTTTTDSGGWYEVDELPLGNYVLMTGTMRLGGASGHVTPLHLRDEGVVERDIELPGTRLVVRVYQAETGGTLAGVLVFVRPRNGSQGGGYLSTDARGEAAFDYLDPGTYTVSAGSASMPLFGGGGGDFSTQLVDPVELRDTDGAPQVVEIRLHEAAHLRARVLGTDGQPVAGAGVHVIDEGGQPITIFSMNGTAPDGWMEIDALPPGRVRVLARHPEWGQTETEAFLRSGGTTEIELRLETGAWLFVLPVDAEGAPMQAVQVIAVDGHGTPVSSLMTGTEAMTMAFQFLSGTEQRLGPLAPGSYEVVLAPLGMPLQKHVVEIPAGMPEVRVRLEYK
ncbi:MAG TPA: carboxypeptidase regulatory-like domain-containing protein [Planctomycetota bacterium]